MPSFGRLFGAALTIAGRPVFLSALATFVAVGIPAVVVFGPQGLSARDLMGAMAGSLPLRAVVWIGWLVLSAQASNAVFVAPGMTAIRAARPRRGPLLVVVLTLAAFVQIPWFLFWFRGAGIGAAFGATTLAIAIASSVFARATAMLVLALVLAVATVRPPVMAAGIVLAPIAIDRAWRTALEERRSWQTWTRATASSVIAMTTVHVLRLVRAERLRLLLAAMIGMVGAAGLLTLRSDPGPRPVGRALAIMAVPFVVGSSLLVAPLVDNERQLDMRLRVLRVRRWAVVAAFLLAIAAPTSAFAATAGVGVGVATEVSPAALGGALGAWALLLSNAVGLWGRRHDRTQERRTVTFAGGVVVIALLAVVAAMEVI